MILDAELEDVILRSQHECLTVDGERHVGKSGDLVAVNDALSSRVRQLLRRKTT